MSHASMMLSVVVTRSRKLSFGLYHPPRIFLLMQPRVPGLLHHAEGTGEPTTDCKVLAITELGGRRRGLRPGGPSDSLALSGRRGVRVHHSSHG